MEETANAILELGTWIGRGQAFGLIASKCSAVQAQCLKQIKENQSYHALGLSWEQFCKEKLGISRSYADQIIRELEEFGAAYFRLGEIMNITAGAYRQIAASVNEEQLEFDGELIPLTPENAPRLREAVAALRRERDEARRPIPAPPRPLSPARLLRRFETLIEAISAFIDRPHSADEESAVAEVILRSVEKLRQFANPA